MESDSDGGSKPVVRKGKAALEYRVDHWKRHIEMLDATWSRDRADAKDALAQAELELATHILRHGR